MTTDLVLSSSWANSANRKLEATKACLAFDNVSPQELKKHYEHESPCKAINDLESLYYYFLKRKTRKREALSPKTVKAYFDGLKTFLEYCALENSKGTNSHSLLAITDDHIDAWIAHLQKSVSETTGRKLSPNSIKNYHIGSSRFYDALVWSRAIRSNPFQFSLPPKDPRDKDKLKAPVTEEAYQRACTILQNDAQAVATVKEERIKRDLAIRDLVIFRLMGDGALRLNEVVNINVEDLDMTNLIMTFVGKGNKVARVGMSEELYQIALAWLGVRDAYAAKGENALIINMGSNKIKAQFKGRRVSYGVVSSVFQRIKEEANLNQGVTPHSLRKRSGIKMRKLHGIEAAQFHMRHENPSTTQIYTGTTDEAVIFNARKMNG